MTQIREVYSKARWLDNKKKSEYSHTYQANFKFNRKYDNLFQGLLEGGFSFEQQKII